MDVKIKKRKLVYELNRRGIVEEFSKRGCEPKSFELFEENTHSVAYVMHPALSIPGYRFHVDIMLLLQEDYDVILFGAEVIPYPYQKRVMEYCNENNFSNKYTLRENRGQLQQKIHIFNPNSFDEKAFVETIIQIMDTFIYHFLKTREIVEEK